MITALPTAEGFDGDEPVVLVERREHDGPAAREVVDQTGLVHPADELDAVVQIQLSAEPRAASSSPPSPAMTQRMPAADGSASARRMRSIRLCGVSRDTANR